MNESTIIKTERKRNSSIELLRILMMLQIIFLHVCEYGEYYDHAMELGGKHALLYWVLWLMSRCPVYMFVIIMGYFLSDSAGGFQKKRILKIYIPMYVYAVAIPVILGFTQAVQVDKYDYIRAVFPALSRTWYFMTLYLIVLILSPFINKMLKELSRKEYLILLGILFFIFSVWQPISHLEPFDSFIGIKKIVDTEGGKSLYDFVFMYILGGFLRHHSFKREGTLLWWKNWMNLAVFLLLGLFNVAFVYIYPPVKDIIAYNDNPIAVLQCIFLFRFFSNMEFYCDILNIISGCNLGIYMLHEHPLMRELIWDKIVRMDYQNFYSTNLYVLNIFLIIVSIFCGCALAELCRQLLAQEFYIFTKKRGC